jgi:hypothetical protein
MDYLSTNLDLLRVKQPGLTKRLEEYTEPASLPYALDKAKNGEWTIKAGTNEPDIRYLHSRFDPSREAQLFIDNINCENKEILFLFGLGLGYHLVRLAAKIKAYSTIVVIEKDLYFLKLFLQLADRSDLLRGKIFFLAGHEIKTAMEELSTFWWNISTNKYEFIHYKPVTGLSVDDIGTYYQQFFKEMRSEINAYQININTIIGRTADVQRNVWGNFDHIIKQPGVNTLFGSMKGKPAIVVAAGPSLNKHIPLLQQCGDNAVIICVDTALKTLLMNGIRPHIVTAIDYLMLNYEKVKGVARDGYYLVALPQVVPEFYEDFRDQLFVVYNNSQFYNWLGEVVEKKGILKSGGSVSHTAFQLALEMGADPIIFVGLDLAFTGGESHSAHSIYSHIKYTPEQLATMAAVDGVDGEKIYTSHDMWGMIVMFEKMVTECGATVIDATEGGALKRGMLRLTFREAFERYCREPFPVHRILKTCYEKKATYDLAKIEAAIQTMVNDVEQLREWAIAGAADCTRLAKQLSKKKGHDAQKVAGYLESTRKHYENIIEKKDLVELLETLLMRITHRVATTKKLFDKNAKVEKGEVTEDAAQLGLFFKGIEESCVFYDDLFKKCQEKLQQEFKQ